MFLPFKGTFPLEELYALEHFSSLGAEEERYRYQPLLHAALSEGKVIS